MGALSYSSQSANSTASLHAAMPISNETLKKPAKTYLFGYPLKRSCKPRHPSRRFLPLRASSDSPFLHNTLYKILHVPRYASLRWPGSRSFLANMRSQDVFEMGNLEHRRGCSGYSCRRLCWSCCDYVRTAEHNTHLRKNAKSMRAGHTKLRYASIVTT